MRVAYEYCGGTGKKIDIAMLSGYISHMDVKIADLKNNLSKHLKAMQRRGESIIIFDRNEPIGIISPLAHSADSDWKRKRDEAMARARQHGLKLKIPLKRPVRLSEKLRQATTAGDGRSDISTVTSIRAEKDY